MKYITPFLLALVILPAVAYGGSVWSQSNVTNTYENRIVEIDAQIEQLTTREVELDLKYPESREYGHNPFIASQFAIKMQIQEEVATLQEEKRILEVAYWLINESFVTTKGQ